MNYKITDTKPFYHSKSSTLGMDLIDMTNKSYKNYKYILTCIDLYSRYIWLFPLKDKTVEKVEKIVNKILKENKNFSVILTDNGTEFNFKDIKLKHIRNKVSKERS